MKYLLLLISLNVFAGAKEDLAGVSHNSFARGASKCGYLEPNKKVLRIKVESENDSAKAACILSKQAEIVSDDATAAAKKLSRGQAKKSFAAADCDTIPGSPILKDMCKALQQ